MKRVLLKEEEEKQNLSNKIYPWWFVVGALLFLQDCVFSWARPKLELLDKEPENQHLWRRYIKNFCFVCLICAGEAGFGFTVNNIRTMYNNLIIQPQSELKKKISYVGAPKNFIDSDLFKKIFIKCSSPSQTLFGSTLVHHPHPTWLNEPNCMRLQKGLFEIVVEHQQCSVQVLSTYFNNYNPETIAFGNISDFSSWWFDLKQSAVFRPMKPNSQVVMQLLTFTKVISRIYYLQALSSFSLLSFSLESKNN